MSSPQSKTGLSSKSLFKISTKEEKRGIIEKKEQENGKMHNYPSDISREQYELIREELENAKRKTKPRKVDLYDVFCAVLYVVKGGIQWRMLPSDFPKWQLCYYYFKVWSAKADKENAESILERILKKL